MLCYVVTSYTLTIVTIGLSLTIFTMLRLVANKRTGQIELVQQKAAPCTIVHASATDNYTSWSLDHTDGCANVKVILHTYIRTVLVHFTAASSVCVHLLLIQYSVPLLSQLQFPINEMV